MWVNRQLFDLVLQDNRNLHVESLRLQSERASGLARSEAAALQKTKDDLTIDWLRNRCNALEKERAILMQKIAGIALPVPEIVASIPRTLQAPPVSFDYLPSFEDVGDEEAGRLKIGHNEDGTLKYLD